MALKTLLSILLIAIVSLPAMAQSSPPTSPDSPPPVRQGQATTENSGNVHPNARR